MRKYLLGGILFICATNTSWADAVVTISSMDNSHCLHVVHSINNWAQERGIKYHYKLKANDLTEVSTTTNEWCRIAAFEEEKEIAQISYSHLNKPSKPQSQVDRYFNNYVEHLAIFPTRVDSWCRAEGCNQETD